MKNKLLIFVTAIVLLLGITIFILSLIFLHDLQTSPDLLVHVIDYPFEYYSVQSDRIARWELYCTLTVIFSGMIIVCSLLPFAFLIFKSQDPEIKKQRKLNRKQKRLEKLQAEVEKLNTPRQ